MGSVFKYLLLLISMAIEYTKYNKQLNPFIAQQNSSYNLKSETDGPAPISQRLYTRK